MKVQVQVGPPNVRYVGAWPKGRTTVSKTAGGWTYSHESGITFLIPAEAADALEVVVDWDALRASLQRQIEASHG